MGCGPPSGSSAALASEMTFPTGGLALTESMFGQTLIVPLIRMLPVVGGLWQSMATDTEVVALATTVKVAAAPEHVVSPSVEVPVSVSE